MTTHTSTQNAGDILVVDDTPANLKLLVNLLAAEGYKVRPATAGEQALGAIAARKPELVLLDINMPEMNGYEVCRRLKAAPDTRDIPVIFISALDALDDSVKGFDLGAVDYIVKPFRDKDVLVRVKNHLALHRMQMRLEEMVAKRTAALKKAQSHITNILESMPSALIGVDLTGRITHWNREAERLTGLHAEDVLERSLDTVVPSLPDAVALFQETLASGQCQSRYKCLVPFDGQEARHVDVSVYPLLDDGIDGAVIRIDDVTEQVRMEEVMIQSEKMLTVGGLAAGMAHEINNPLAGLIQNANVLGNRLLKADLPANVSVSERIGIPMEKIVAYIESRGVPDMLAAMMASGLRISEIVSNMLSFARKGEGQFADCDLRELIERVLQLAQTEYNLKKNYDFRNIRVEKHYADDLPAIPCLSSQLEQVLLNIFTNGAQAMQTLAAQRKDYTPCFTVRLSPETDMKMVRMEIEDNGPGMDVDTQKRIFDPFFTTKPVGEGTGLGLSVSYYIVTENHGGKMTVASTPNAGTTFTIRLPLTGEA